ncbi:hypothetical protein Esti_004193 [Eimeria stiedai]
MDRSHTGVISECQVQHIYQNVEGAHKKKNEALESAVRYARRPAHGMQSKPHTLSQLYFAFLISFSSLATERFSTMVKEEAIRQGLQSGRPDRPLERRKAQKHAPPRVSPVAQHPAQPSPTKGSQPEVLERFHTALSTDIEDSRLGDPSEEGLGAAPAVVPPAVEAGPLSQKLSTPQSRPFAGPPSPSKMQLTRQLSPVRSTVASTGKQTQAVGHNANVEASQPVLMQPQIVESIGRQQPATLATQGASLNLHKQLPSLKHQTFLKQFLHERNRHKLLSSLKTLSKLKTLQCTPSEAVKLRELCRRRLSVLYAHI